MARISHDDFSGQSDIGHKNTVQIDANTHNKIEVSNSDFIANANISRDSQDLVLETTDGNTVIVENYFTADPAPLIESPDGSVLTPNLINSFLSSSPQYAVNGTMDDISPVGSIEEISGEATVTRTDGTSENLTLGSPIYEGDVIETSNDGAVNVVFVDETSMAVSDGARLSIDDYSFDTETESGTTNFSVLKGIFVFTSGLIGRDDPDDVLIETPVGSIGIRGTIIAGKIQPGGESEITVMEGAIVVKNGAMETTLSQQYESVKLLNFNDNIQELGVKNASDVSKTYGSVSDVVPKLFSSINDAVKEEQTNKSEAKEATEEADPTSEADEITVEEVIDEAIQEPKIEENIELNLNDVKPEPIEAREINKKPLKKELFSRSQENKDFENDPSVTFNQGEKDPEFTVIERPVFEGAETGTLVSRIVIRNAPPNVSFSVNGPGVSNYTHDQISNGVFEIRLNNPAGVQGTSIGDFTVTATFADGQTFNWSLTPQTLDASVNIGIDGGLLGHDVQNIGNFVGPKKIGDFNGDGTDDFAHINGTNDLIIEDVPASIIGSVTGNNFESIANAGDLNNDGYADIIAGNPSAGASQGGVFTINGTTGSATANISGSLGNSGDSKGFAVTGLGDFDGDGKTDFAHSSPGHDAVGTDRGKVQIIASDGDFSLTGHSDNMKLGDYLDYIGDVDGNGFSDLFVTSEGTVGGLHKAYVVLGHGGSNTNIDTLDLGSKLFEIESSHDIIGGGFVGDTNGDGFDDFAISLQAGSSVNTFVVYGQDGFPNTITDTHLEDPNFALKINHEGVSGSNYEVAGVGDINGDGLDDIRLGEDGSDKFIVHGKGSSDLVTDSSPDDGAPEIGLVEATATGQSLFGNGHFRDNGEDDISMVGGNGNNSFGIADTAFRNIDGGAGTDTIRFSGTSLDFSSVNFEEVSGIEKIHFAQDNSAITLTTENIFNLLKTSDNGTLTIELGATNGTPATTGFLNIEDNGVGSSGGTFNKIEELLDKNGDNTAADDAVNYHGINGDGNHHYEIGGYNLYVDADLTTAVI